MLKGSGVVSPFLLSAIGDPSRSSSSISPPLPPPSSPHASPRRLNPSSHAARGLRITGWSDANIRDHSELPPAPPLPPPPTIRPSPSSFPSPSPPSHSILPPPRDSLPTHSLHWFVRGGHTLGYHATAGSPCLHLQSRPPPRLRRLFLHPRLPLPNRGRPACRACPAK
jgi:hypothetical protein